MPTRISLYVYNGKKKKNYLKRWSLNVNGLKKRVIIDTGRFLLERHLFSIVESVSSVTVKVKLRSFLKFSNMDFATRALQFLGNMTS